jgi:hypothetical protein
METMNKKRAKQILRNAQRHIPGQRALPGIGTAIALLRTSLFVGLLVARSPLSAQDVPTGHQLAVPTESAKALPSTTGAHRQQPNDFTVTFFPASDYNPDTPVMDATFGTTWYLIDTFEATPLLPGLSITLSANIDPSPVTWTSLPNLYPVSTETVTVDNEWDGSDVATNNPQNQYGGNTDYSTVITFNYPAGAASVGIGLANFQSLTPPSPFYPITQHDLFVNGVDLGTIEVLAGNNWTPGIVRNAYVLIDAINGNANPITSVGFQNDAGIDWLLFDHLAIQPVVALTPTSGTPQSAIVDGAFQSALTITVTNPLGAPVSGLTVNFAAPASGASATLSPTSVVTGSDGTASVTATANAVAGPYTVAATLYGLTANFSLTNVALSTLTLSPAAVVGGNPTTANTVALTSAAPPSGAIITLTSSNPSVATVPSSITVAGGSAVSQPFTITTASIRALTDVTVSASDGTNTKQATLTVAPASLTAVKLSPKSVVGGKSTTNNTVSLNGPAPAAGAVVTLSSSNSAVAAVPASVTVPAGATASPTFTITTTAVATQTEVTISGTYRGATKTATITVNSPQLALLTLRPTSVKGGGTTTQNILALNAPAPAGGAIVMLTSGNPAVASVPATVTIPSGATSTSFTITTTAVTANTLVPITGTYGGSTKSATLTVTP